LAYGFQAYTLRGTLPPRADPWLCGTLETRTQNPRARRAQAERQAELAYTIDFQMVVLERKAARAAGERTEDEASVLQARIAALNEALQRACAEHGLVAVQLKHAEDGLGARGATHVICPR